MSGERVPIPGTERQIWPNSRHAESLGADVDVHLTAWLRPQPGGTIDAGGAQTLGATLPASRTYADRKTFARQTGADPTDVDLLRRYCESFGLTVFGSHWRSVDIAGPIERMIHAFGATVAVFEDAGKRRFRHRSRALHVPPDIAAVVSGIFGLHQWPRSRKIATLERHATPLLAAQVARRYRFPDADGSGRTIGILQLRGRFQTSDFDQCMAAQGVSPGQPIVKRVDGAAVEREHATTKDLEAALDVQIIASLAPGARIVVYEAPDDERGFLDAIRDALFDEEYAPSVLSVSYGWPEHLWTPVALKVLDDLLVAAAFLGVSVLCSSGDNGAELDYDGAPHVLAPASSPFAMACGATVIPSDGAPERAWEQTGGGFSERFEVPVWQDVARAAGAHYGVPPGRGVPDVAAQQSPGYYVVMNGVELAIGGSSAVAPVWSALIARMHQRLGFAPGFFLPILYARSGDALFGAVTEGSNGRYEAAAGWNPCTGLGVPNGLAIEAALRGTAR